MRKLARLAGVVTIAFAALALSHSAAAQEQGWPRDIPAARGTITVYQPQLESLSGDIVKARAAVSFSANDGKDPVFGVTWMSATVRTNRDDRTVTVSSPITERTRFPEITPDQEKQFAAIVDPAISAWTYTMSLDHFTAALATADREKKSAEALKSDPPKIIVTMKPSVLVFVDGAPKLQDIEGTSLQRVANTPVAILFDKKSKKFYTSNGTFWYAASAAAGPYSSIAKPPAEVQKVVADAMAKAPKEVVSEDKQAEPPKAPPNVVVTTEPAELVSFEGQPQWKPVTGTNLLYAANTATSVFKDITTQQTYVLLTGRWFTSKTFDGPWTFVPADKIPLAFASIPPDSDEGSVRASVAGTAEAEEAVLDAQIPQTSAIDRKTAKLEVTYDGAPRFEAIPGAGIQYAVNTPASVLKVKGSYYACDQAVWYVSSSPTGPWIVSDKRPEEVDAIPPSNPVYNVKYVYVYSSTPTVVYVGYTPGYMGCYPWGPTVVWGTGWYYPGWYGAYYYPRPVTWGLGVAYNPWTGWSMGVGWSSGFYSFGMSFYVGGGYYGGYRGGYYGGWYGAGGYRPPYYRPPGHYPPGYHPGYPGYRPPTTQYASNNLYDRPQNRARNAPEARPAQRPATAAARPGASGPGAPAARPGTLPTGGAATREARPATGNAKVPGGGQARPNDVYAGKDGGVYRNDANSWKKRDQGNWKPDASAGQQLQRDAQARERGNQRAESYQRSQAGAGATNRTAPRSSAPAPRKRN